MDPRIFICSDDSGSSAEEDASHFFPRAPRLHNYWSSNLPDPVYKFSIPLAHNSDVVPAMASGMTTLVTLSALRASE